MYELQYCLESEMPYCIKSYKGEHNVNLACIMIMYAHVASR